MDADITIRPQQFWCWRHLESFEARWPVGYLIATMYVLETVLGLDEVLFRTGGDPAKMQPVLLKIAPLCCIATDRLGESWLDDIVGRAIAMDPKLVQDIKARRGTRMVRRMEHERNKWKLDREAAS